MKDVLVVTGSGSGIGLETAKFTPKEKIVVISGRTVAKLESADDVLCDDGSTNGQKVFKKNRNKK